MAKFVGLLLLPLLVALAQAILAAAILGKVFGYGVIVIVMAIPVAYIPTLLVGLPVIGSATELPSWRSELVGALCAVPACYVFTDCHAFEPHMARALLTLASWLAVGALLGEVLVFRKGLRSTAP